MLEHKIGIEIEFTGITREKAARIVAGYLGGTIQNSGDYYDTYKITAPDGRVWKIMYDGSINCQRKYGRVRDIATKDFSCELVSPILTYREDIATIQELVRRLRKAGAFANDTCGIHIHLDNEGHTPRSVRNFINIIASKNDLFYKALQIPDERVRYCKKMDDILVDKLNRCKPKTMSAIEKIWYEGYSESQDRHYHNSRYHFFYGQNKLC